MFARIEVAMRPEFADPAADGMLRKLELAHPEIRRKVRWARWIEVAWLELPCGREEVIPALSEVFWDRVLLWMFTGNILPSAAGKNGGILDLMEASPHRPGKFWAIERRYRPGVTDNVGRTMLEAFEIVLKRPIAEARAASGSLILLEGPELGDADLGVFARDVLCNELIETFTLVPEAELTQSDRFHQERIRRDLPKVSLRASEKLETLKLEGLDDSKLEELSRSRLWALSAAELRAIRAHFTDVQERERRRLYGLSDPTDVELEVLAQTWSEHCKHKIFGARVSYRDESGEKRAEGPGDEIPAEIDGLFRETITGTTAEIARPWLLSVFSDNAGIVAFDADDAFCVKVETHNTPSALDPYGGALTGLVGVNRDILGCGLGARPIANTNVFCLAPPDWSAPLPERLLHPRRILEGVRHGVEHGGNKSGVPTVNGALYFDARYLGKPLVYCGTVGFMPRIVAGRPCESKEIRPGDRICMVGGRIGKDGIHGATFSSLALDEASPSSAVQLGDPITQKRAADFLLEARDLGLYRAITDNGAGGLSSSVGELARLSGGARMDISKAKTKYPGLKPYELVVSESQERMTVAVPPEKLEIFLALARRRASEVSDLGSFTDSGSFDVFHGDRAVASLPLEFLHGGAPRLSIEATWSGRPEAPAVAAGESFEHSGAKVLLELLGRPNVASKEWLIRQYDHEVQAASVIKPLHVAGLLGGGTPSSGPNDAGVLKPKSASWAGLAVGCGLQPRLSDVDAYLMAQAAVDEAVRNVLCCGAEFGAPESVLALVDNFCWPDPVASPKLAGDLVRACYGMREAALSLGAPFISGKDSMKNDYRGRLEGQEIRISVPPTLLVTAVGRVSDVRQARSADFKAPGDLVYLLRGSEPGLIGSELHFLRAESSQRYALPGTARLPVADWSVARRIYAWLGGTAGKEQPKLRSAHDVSDGGLLVSVAESCLARGLGAVLQLPEGVDSQTSWEYCYGEGFHAFVVSISEGDAAAVESEWTREGVPFQRLGSVTGGDRVELRWRENGEPRGWGVETRKLRAAWRKEGYWQ